MATVSNLTLYFLEGAMESFTNLVVPVTAMSYNVQPTGAGLNDIVRVPFVLNTSASSDFAYSTGYANTGNAVTGKNVTLDGLKYQLFNSTDSEILRMSPEVIRRLGRQAGSRLGSDVLNNVMGAVTSSAFPNSSSYVSNEYSSSAAWTALVTIADNLKWPEERAVVVEPTTYGYMLSNASLVNYAYGSPVVVQDGKIPKYFGFNPYRVTNYTAKVDAYGTSVGFALHPNGILVGMAYHSPQDELPYTEKQMIKDEKSGLVLGWRVFPDMAKATVYRAVDCLFGKATGDPNGVVIIRS